MHINGGINLLKYVCATKRREDPDAKVDIQKILFFHTGINKVDINYINFLTENLPINWGGNEIDLPYTGEDLSVNIQNQYSSKINMKPLTREMKAGIVEVVGNITGEDRNKLKKVLANIEKSSKFAPNVKFTS